MLRPGWRSTGKTIVWTNGCFDLLHAGHIRNLKDAKALGDILVVGINSDRSVRKNKGDERPIIPEAQRAEIVAALGCVDYVVLFDDDTPLDILRSLQPDVHCKGADYANGRKPMPEADVISTAGGRIAFLELHLNYSTTAVIEKIRAAARAEHDSIPEPSYAMTADEGSDAAYPSVVDRLSEPRVAIVGDVMLDEYVAGKITRISPEAPVPIIDVVDRRLSPGGAANVAANVAGLGAGSRLIGLVADDTPGRAIRKLLHESGVNLVGLVEPGDRQTICKTRLVAGQQQIVRVDQESKAPLGDADFLKVTESVAHALVQAHVCVLSDYGKGMLTEKLCQEVIRLAHERGRPTIVDPKGKDFRKYRGCSVITPNQYEAAIAAGIEIESERDLHQAGEILLQILPGACVLITRGSDGMTLFRECQDALTIPTMARTVFDVVGAGDTAVATLAVAVGAGLPIETAIKLANIAAGIVVEKHGTVAVGIDELTAHPETIELFRTDHQISIGHAYAGRY